MLETAGLRPQRMFGQNFLIDSNLLRCVVELADVGPGDVVLEIGPGTGTLTDELLAAGATVLAVEIDRGLAALLADRYAEQPRLHLMNCDVLAGKHAINPEVLAAANQLGPGGIHIIGNLPYNVATPLVCELLMLAVAADRNQEPHLRCTDLTVTIQREVAQRLAAGPDDKAYGPASVLVSLLAAVHLGKRLGPEAFWPRPQVASRMVRIDANPPPVEQAPDVRAVQKVATLAFGQRRKKIAALTRRRDLPWPPEACSAAMAAAGIDPNVRPERITPEQYARLAAELSRYGGA